MGFNVADEDKAFQQEVEAVKQWWKVSLEEELAIVLEDMYAHAFLSLSAPCIVAPLRTH